MIAVDTNILVYTHREDSAHHVRAHRALERLAAAGSPWAVPWPCLHEFLAVVTHPRILRSAVAPRRRPCGRRRPGRPGRLPAGGGDVGPCVNPP
jgi:predicted nucleic acid-binding protein